MNPLESIPERMRSDIEKAAGIIRGEKRAIVVSHYDADGIGSAVILGEALERMGVESRCIIFHGLSEEELDIVCDLECDLIVMADMGASFVDELSSGCGRMIVLDHHKSPSMDSIDEREGFVFINPHTHGIDGGRSACGSTLSYLLALALDFRNADLAPVAMAGMIGDMQDLGGFDGVNKAVVDDAIDDGVVRTLGICPFPMTGSIGETIECTTEPYLKGITGDREAISGFLGKMGIGFDSPLRNLPPESLEMFNESVGFRLRSNSVAEDAITAAMRMRYLSIPHSMDISHLSSILDGCGRTENFQLVSDACRSMDFSKAEEVSRSYYKGIADSVYEVFSEMVQMDNVQHITVSRPSMTGILCGTIMRYLGDQDKPTLGMGMSDPEKVTFSSRGTSRLVSMGLNLAAAMRESGRSVGGNGGGHSIAAGGDCPHGRERDFVEAFDRIVGEQLHPIM